MGDGRDWIDNIPGMEFAEWRGPSPLRELGIWTPPRPTTPPELDSSASTACNSSTNRNDLASRHNGQPSRTIPPTTPESQRIRPTPQSSNGNLNIPPGLNGPPQTLRYTTVLTARDFRSPEPSVRQAEPIPSHSSYTPSFGTSDSVNGFSIKLHKPQPTQGAVLVPRIETHIYLDIGLPLQSPMTWNAIQVPSTTSVKRVDELSGGEDINPLTLDITVRGATTRRECNRVCGQCEERVGQRMGQPSLIDFHGPSNLIRTKSGTARVHFTFCCYSRHHQKEDEQFVLEVILKDASNCSEPMVVARKDLPYSFDVMSKSRIRGPTRDQISLFVSPEIRRRVSTSPATTPTAQLGAWLHAEGVELQTQREQVVGGILAGDQAGQRTIGHASSMAELEQQGSSAIQRLLFVIPDPHPRVLLAPDRRGSACGGDKDSVGDSQDPTVTRPSGDGSYNLGNTTSLYHGPAFSEDKAITTSEGPNNVGSEEGHKRVVGTPHQRVEEPCICTCVEVMSRCSLYAPTPAPCDSRANALTASDVSAGHFPDVGIRRAQFYNTPIILGQEEKPAPTGSFASIRRHSFDLYHFPMDTEKNQTRAKVAEREAQIDALEMKIRNLRTTFDAESQEKSAALQPIMDHLYGQRLSIHKEIVDHWNAFSAERHEARAAITAMVTDLELQIHILKQENSNTVSLLAPIWRLPAEILAEIFVLSTHIHAQSPLDLIHVCRFWRSIVFGMPRIWSTIRLSTWTKPSKTAFILEQTREIPLDVEINACAGELTVGDGVGGRLYASLAMAAKEAKRWRTLTITGFPHKTDIDAYSSRVKPTFMFNGPMDALQSFKIKTVCEDTNVFGHLLDVVGSSSHEMLTDMELSSPNAIHHLAQPHFAAIFHHLVTFKADVRKMRTEVDILTHFEQLETLEAHFLRLPTYTVETNLPLIRTLRRMKITAVSVQWMAGRTFPSMEECAIIFPRNPETLAHGGGIDLPMCTQFTYDDHTINVLPNFRIPKLDTLIIRNDTRNKLIGSTELAAVWSGVVGQVTPLRPRVLHLDAHCHGQYLINALGMLPELEELYLGVVRPDGLGKKFFAALGAEKGRSSHLCPNLRTFGIRYRHWIRDGEHDQITPLLHRIIESRQKDGAPLQSVKFWATKDTPDGQALELCRSTKDVDRKG